LRVPRILLQAGKAGARRFLSGNEAPPEAVAEANRPEHEEEIERQGHQALEQSPPCTECLAQCEPHQERQRHHHADDQRFVGD
jgi:hypothetical protein